MIGLLFDLLKCLIAAGKFLRLHLLCGKRLDDPLTEQGILDLRIQLSDLHALPAERRPQILIQDDRHHRHERHTDKDEYCQRNTVPA